MVLNIYETNEFFPLPDKNVRVPSARMFKMIGQAINPAVWNPPASAGGGMRCNPRRSHYFGEPPASAGGGSINLCNLSNIIRRKGQAF